MSITVELLEDYLEFYLKAHYNCEEDLPKEDLVESIIEDAFNLQTTPQKNFTHWLQIHHSEYYSDLIESHNSFRMLREVGQWLDDFGCSLDYKKLTPEWTLNSYAYFLAKDESGMVDNFIERVITIFINKTTEENYDPNDEDDDSDEEEDESDAIDDKKCEEEMSCFECKISFSKTGKMYKLCTADGDGEAQAWSCVSCFEEAQFDPEEVYIIEVKNV